MSIKFPCQGCKNILRAPDEAAGRKIRCPNCSAIQEVPSDDTPTHDVLVSPDVVTLDDIAKLVGGESEAAPQPAKPDAAAPKPAKPYKPPVPPKAEKIKTMSDAKDLTLSDSAMEVDLTPFEDKPASSTRSGIRSPLNKSRTTPAAPTAPAAAPAPVDESPVDFVPPARTAPPPPPVTAPPVRSATSGSMPNFENPAAGASAAPVEDEPEKFYWGSGPKRSNAKRQAGTVSDFLAESLRAIKPAGENMGSAFVLSLIYALLSMGLMFLFSLAVTYLVNKDNFELASNTLFLLMFLISLLLGGYGMRFMLDNIQAGIDNSAAPVLPSLDIANVFFTGLRWLGMTLIYWMPIVTIPLWPLGMLAWAHTDDGRAFNIIWALRTAMRRPGALAALWLMMLLWFIVAILLTIPVGIIFGLITAAIVPKVHDAGSASIWVYLITFGMTIVMMTLSTTLAMASARCTGLLGYFFPDVIDSLPQRSNGFATLGFLAGGCVVSLLIYFTLTVAILVAVSDTVRNSGGPLASLVPSARPSDQQPPPPDDNEASNTTQANLANPFTNAGNQFGNGNMATNGTNQASDAAAERNKLRTVLMTLWADSSRYALKHDGRFPSSVMELVNWLRDDGARTDEYTTEVRAIPMSPGLYLTSPEQYILAGQLLPASGQFMYVTRGGQVSEDTPLAYDMRRRRQMQEIALANRAGNTISGNNGAGNNPGNAFANNSMVFVPPGNLPGNVANRVGNNAPKPVRKFPVKPIPVGSSETERAQLKLENLYANLKEYEARKGEMPARLYDLVREDICEFTDIRGPGGWEYEYEKPTADAGLIILSADRSEYQLNRTTTVMYVLLSTGRVVSGASIDDIRKRFVAVATTQGTEEGGELVWTVPKFSVVDTERAAIGKYCRILLRHEQENLAAYAGVDVGAAAKDRKDKAYVDYKDQMRANIAELSSTTVKETEDYKIVGNSTVYDRFTGTRPGGKTVTVLLSVENGHCVAYWYSGPGTQYGVVQAAVGKAAIKTAASAPAPK